MLCCKEVEALTAEVQTLWEREGILYWQTHVGYSKLSLYTAILELHCTVHDTLWVNQHLYLFRIYSKKPLCLDNLKAFVHHRSRVDGNLGTHIPCGVLKGIGLGNVGNLFHRLQTERTTGGCQQDLLYRVLILTYKTLEDGRVLAVNG